MRKKDLSSIPTTKETGKRRDGGREKDERWTDGGEGRGKEEGAGERGP